MSMKNWKAATKSAKEQILYSGGAESFVSMKTLPTKKYDFLPEKVLIDRLILLKSIPRELCNLASEREPSVLIRIPWWCTPADFDSVPSNFMRI